jgi:hypothetical protein
VRTDPTDTGGLFVGRRPGTAPTRYGAPPERGGGARRCLDALLAHLLLMVMVVLGFCFLLLALSSASRSSSAWTAHGSSCAAPRGSISAAGALGRVFGTTAVIAAIGFTAWLLLVGGLGPTLAPR